MKGVLPDYIRRQQRCCCCCSRLFRTVAWFTVTDLMYTNDTVILRRQEHLAESNCRAMTSCRMDNANYLNCHNQVQVDCIINTWSSRFERLRSIFGCTFPLWIRVVLSTTYYYYFNYRQAIRTTAHTQKEYTDDNTKANYQRHNNCFQKNIFLLSIIDTQVLYLVGICNKANGFSTVLESSLVGFQPGDVFVANLENPRRE
ncbi:hypothetical protein T11_6526 [Trichinella zimbabwensis]|uniref:Uncharacterized protein n=1 Tax=Trichinella zimbabwensis TaxID=268475 RepID=A0A0V1GVB8_9BILA|nr:hypothetical protein T11_6526 [Trichinella zimbabwensis]